MHCEQYGVEYVSSQLLLFSQYKSMIWIIVFFILGVLFPNPTLAGYHAHYICHTSRADKCTGTGTDLKISFWGISEDGVFKKVLPMVYSRDTCFTFIPSRCVDSSTKAVFTSWGLDELGNHVEIEPK